jgi:hypothetical protein
VRTVLLILVTALLCPAACLLQDIGGNASAQGTLAAGCLVSDLVSGSLNSAYAVAYRIQIAAPTVLTVRVTSTAINPYLYLTTQSGSTLASNDDADGGTDSRITISVNPGVYIAIATSRTTVAGPFTVTTATEPLRSCRILDASAGSSASGALTDSSCRTLDLRVPSTDDRPVDRYRLSLSKRSAVTVELKSTDFDTYLELRDAEGSRLAADHASAGARFSRMLSSVAPGVYTIYAYPYRKATGAYVISTAVDALRTCTPKDLAPGAPSQPAVVAGSFTADSCRVLDLLVPSADNTYVELYRVSLAKKSVVTVKQQSSVVDSYLAVTDSSYESIFENEDASANTADAAIFGSLAAGTYYVFATESEQAAGPYSLSLAAEDPRPCPVKDLAAGAAADGAFASDSCRWLDIVIPSEDAVYVTQYRVTLARRSVIAIDMKSASVDAYLVVATPQYKALFGNDDATDDSTDSRILASLEAGTYLVLATTYDLETGPYTAALAVEEPRNCPARDVGRTDSVSGALTDRSCRYLDLVSPSDDPTPLDLFRLTADSRGVLSLDLAATGFSPWLALTDSNYDSYYDTDGDTAVKTDLLILPGAYYLIVNSMDRGGDYTFKTRFGPARDCPNPSIGVQDKQAGSLTAAGCRFSDFVPFTDTAVPASQHRVTLTQRGELQAKVASTDFVPALLIANENNTDAPAYDLNLAGAAGAEASATLPPGVYNIIVISLASGGAGPYTVTTGFSPSAVVK